MRRRSRDAVPDDAGMVPVFLDTTIGFVLFARAGVTGPSAC